MDTPISELVGTFEVDVQSIQRIGTNRCQVRAVTEDEYIASIFFIMELGQEEGRPIPLIGERLVITVENQRTPEQEQTSPTLSWYSAVNEE